jgi:hypothetical protein
MLTALTTNVFAQGLTQSIDQQLTKLLEQDDLLPQDIEWKMTSNHISSISGVQHGYYSQVINGIQVYGTESGIHLTSSGTVLAADNRFINKTAYKLRTTTPSLNAVQAVQAAARQLNYSISAPLSVIESNGGVSQETLLSDGGISLSPIPVNLMYQLNDNNELVLVWNLSIQETSQVNWWNVRVDANTGQIVDKNDFMATCSIKHNHENEHPAFIGPLNKPESKKEALVGPAEANEAAVIGSYRVYAIPVESPNHGPRTLEVDPHNLTASPFGWHDTDGIAGAESTLTTGNNVDAHKGSDRPDGTAALVFDFPIDLTQNPTTNTPPYITNLFFWNNITHDLFYIYGFDEVSGNFQENNYGNGGLGSDSVNANAQASGNCNANFGTPPDGQNPTMNMFLCSNASPPHDGDLDNGVIVHEYGHGISNRLTGGPANVGCLNNSEQMGEGWSDLLGIIMTIEPGDTGDDARGIGTYLLGQPITGNGVRQFRYSTDLTVNPHTYGDLPTQVIPHGVGSVWAAITWEVVWALIDEHGFDPDAYNFTGDVTQDAGNVQALAIITEGMKLQPCSPGFVDGRDAIFAADLAIYGGANECLLWTAFAKRGLGFSADQGSSNSTNDGTEAFDSPVPAINTTDEVCVGMGIQVFGGGTPTGGVYSGPGVTDDGNGLTYTFDPAVAGVGIHAIGYDVTTSCATGTAFDNLEVTPDEPEVLCQDITLELDINGEATLTIYDIVTNLEPGALVVDQTGTFAPIDITATGTTVSLTDDSVSGALPVGFNFSYYGVDYTDFYISSNGFITFDGANGSGCCTGGIIPDGSDENNLIALAWEDLNPASGGTIRYETVGSAPDRKLVAEYDAVPFFGTSDLVTTQVHLFEGSNRIEIHSTAIPANGSVTMGIENQDGSMGLPVPGRNSQTWSVTNDYVAFYYAPGGPADNCGSATTISLSQSLFTCDDRPSTVVTVTVTDGNGNVGTCTPTITISDPLDVCPPLGISDNIFDQNISIFPNPSNGQITLVNNSNSEIKSATITDVNGRTIQSLNVDNATTRTTFSIESLAQGMYFVKIEAENNSTVKRLLKN